MPARCSDTGLTTDNTLTISGGNDRTLLYLSGSYNNQTGTFVGPQNSYKRYSFRLKGSHRVTDNFTVGGNVAYSNADGRFIQKGSNFSGVSARGAGGARPNSTTGTIWTPPRACTAPTASPIRRPHPSAQAAATTTRSSPPTYPSARRSPTGCSATSSLEYRAPHRGCDSTTPWEWITPATIGSQGQPQTSSNIPNPLGQVVKVDLVNSAGGSQPDRHGHVQAEPEPGRQFHARART